jgi:hypothetical protein
MLQISVKFQADREAGRGGGRGQGWFSVQARCKLQKTSYTAAILGSKTAPPTNRKRIPFERDFS